MGNRVAEIPTLKYISGIKSSDHIADLGTRDRATMDDIEGNSAWQLGPEWFETGEEEMACFTRLDQHICSNRRTDQP